ncbi:uncharacterized protein LACBIDRAFT_302257 [Laccaria bicolor S238N-H82]|uniref:Predicted protein n=1 Tax=Laccaria bicolor (strain S238N-H82 / ATCC MYA-4686) TaxID=486041 RepID=B0DHE6_LACBS|nr:uncharacterized protein LACBIDRAFT_302257 [Laccaria bicolor S238N-H82]EDR06004.1 predicted protein [Laccaria bicolor S238N-H82]|eukprot:XP_001883292.1 predicted protein [Laccaria bicolor S238N-H82]
MTRHKEIEEPTRTSSEHNEIIIMKTHWILIALATAVSVFAIPTQNFLDAPVDRSSPSNETIKIVYINRDCFWSGNAPYCAGSCDPPYVEVDRNQCGDGQCCWSGSKALCCKDESRCK